MNINDFVKAKKRDIEVIKNTENLTKQIKETLANKYRENLKKVDKKLLEIASATKELGINHLEFSLPYRDKYDSKLRVHADGYMYVGDGGFLFHRPNDKADDISLFRIAPMLSDVNCIENIEQAFIEKVNAYFEKRNKESSEEFKRTFDELSCLRQKKKFIVSIATDMEIDADDMDSAESVALRRFKNVDCLIKDCKLEEVTNNVKKGERDD